MKAKHAEKKTSITISLRLFIGIIVLFVLIIVAVTYYSVYRELNTGNNNSAAASAAATAAETNDISASESSQNTPREETSEPTFAATEATQPESTATEPATKATTSEGSTESAVKLTSFSAEMYPYKAFDNVGKRDASVKEVFGTGYGGEGITFDENGLFSDNITQSESNYGIYTVSDGTIKLSYSNDKTKTAEIISYKNNVPSEMKIDYVGYDVYFKIGSAE